MLSSLEMRDVFHVVSSESTGDQRVAIQLWISPTPNSDGRSAHAALGVMPANRVHDGSSRMQKDGDDHRYEESTITFLVNPHRTQCRTDRSRPESAGTITLSRDLLGQRIRPHAGRADYGGTLD